MDARLHDGTSGVSGERVVRCVLGHRSGGPEAAARREQHTLLAAALTSGPVELLDFLLPLWAGAVLGASATQVGVLVAVEMAVSVVARPLAGVLADTRERRMVAAGGALLYGLSCLGYAAAESMPLAYASAVLGGIGGGLLWVAVRAIISERLAQDSAVFPRLLAAQENGVWVAFVAALSLLQSIDYRGIFLGCAASCLIGALALVTGPRQVTDATGSADADVGRLGAVARRLRPMLLAIVLTMGAEAAVGMLLLLHLQRGFGLEVLQIALVFLPGAVAAGLLPEYLHRLVLHFGRRRVLAAASVSSAAFAAGLAWAPNPLVVAALWVLSGVAWAAVLPIQQAVVAEATGRQAGRGMGWYESASLLGGLAGALVAGVLYDTGSWTVACLVTAAVILAGAVVVPMAVQQLGVPDIPVEAPPAPSAPAPSAATPVEPAAHPAVAPGSWGPQPPEGPAEAATPSSRPLRELGEHAALFLAAHILLAVVDLSWLFDVLTRETPEGQEGPAGLLYSVGRIWTFVLLGDALWRVGEILRLRRRRAAGG
jgi:MFS transporter, DHA1 family, multidrug resistance protein